MREGRCVIALLVDLKDFVILKKSADTKHRPLIFAEFVRPKLAKFMFQLPSFIVRIMWKPYVADIEAMSRSMLK